MIFKKSEVFLRKAIKILLDTRGQIFLPPIWVENEIPGGHEPQ